MSVRHECRNCAKFSCEVMCGGRPLEDRGECHRSRSVRKFVEADDCCNQWVMAAWAKNESEVRKAQRKGGAQ